MEHADLVVIGAGLGGLAAAATAAAAGRRVLVLEQESTPGGYATCFQRGPYRFDASLHALDALAPGGGHDTAYRELGLTERVRLHRLDPLYVARYPDRDVVAHADPFHYESELIGHFPHEAAGLRAYLDETYAVYRDGRRLEEDVAAGRGTAPEDVPARYPALARVSGETWEAMMSRHVADPRARSALGALAGYGGLPPSRLAALMGAMMTAGYQLFGGWYPEGGSGALSRALAQVVQERGGEIRYEQTVSGFEMADGRVAAVLTTGGLRVATDAVISNASAPSTMLDLVGREHLPPDYAGRVEAPVPGYTAFAVYLGLDRDVFAEQGLPHELFLFPGYDTDASWAAAASGDWDRTGLMVTDYTRVDPGCAPDGGGVIVLTTAAAWDFADVWGTGGDLTDYHRNPRYVEIKERVADAVLARATAAVPGLADAVRLREASTPLSNFAWTHNPRGAIEGYENSPENSGIGWLPQTTPVTNLFLAGAWTNTGGQNPAIRSGIGAARMALRAMALPAS